MIRRRISICRISDAELQAIFFRQATPAWLSSTSQMLNCGNIVAMASSVQFALITSSSVE